MATVAGTRRGPDEELVTRTLLMHGRALLATAQRHSLCPDDAADAYQRALEIFLRHAERLDPTEAHKWLHTVVKHEAITLRAERQRVLPRHVHDFVSTEARHEPSPDDAVLDVDHVARMSEALTRLKPAEAQALWLQAAGRSYEQIADDLGWTRTKVNRCLAEGRARLRAGMEGIETGEECARWEPVLGAIADGSAGAAELSAARRHLRNCPGCRAGVRALHEQRGQRTPGLAACFPVGLILAGMHERVVGGIVRAQSLLDALTNGKAAAVAASAAAIAGGSITVVDRALEPDRARQGTVRAVVAADPARPPARPGRVRRAPEAMSGVVRARRIGMASPTASPPRRTPEDHTPSGDHDELAPGRVAGSGPSTATPSHVAPVPGPTTPTAAAASRGSVAAPRAQDGDLLP